MSASVSSGEAPLGAWPMARAMVGVGLVCGVLIVGVYEMTRPRIERARAAALRQAVFEVLPAASSSVRFVAEESGGFAPRADGGTREAVVHAGYDAEGRLVGLALEGAGMGYQDVIRLLYGYALDRQAIIGLHVLESRETPGLGDRVESDPGFLANFVRLDVSLTEEGDAVAHPIEVVKPDKKQEAWQIDGLSGATITSQAIGRILRESTQARLPGIRARIEDFARGITP